MAVAMTISAPMSPIRVARSKSHSLALAAGPRAAPAIVTQRLSAGAGDTLGMPSQAPFTRGGAKIIATLRASAGRATKEMQYERILVSWRSRRSSPGLPRRAGGSASYGRRGASDLHWLVYKAGTLSRLGHNHMISVGDLTGTSTTPGTGLASAFDLSFSVGVSVVDDPHCAHARRGLRERADSRRHGRNSQEHADRQCARRREVPEHSSSRAPAPSRPRQQTLTVKVELLGRSVDLTVPTEVVVSDDSSARTANSSSRMRDLGMKPFSVMLGALQVAENMKFVYGYAPRRHLRATERPGAAARRSA